MYGGGLTTCCVGGVPAVRVRVRVRVKVSVSLRVSVCEREGERKRGSQPVVQVACLQCVVGGFGAAILMLLLGMAHVSKEVQPI